MKFYTWKDIERYCKLHRNVWEDTFQNIDVYNDLIIAQKNMSQSSEMEASVLKLKELFGDKYLEASHEVLLDIDGKSIPIEFQDEEVYSTSTRSEARPTFSDSPYYENIYPLKELETLTKPVIAFHSYKGGVGRTLSAIAFSRAWPEIFLSENKNSRLLIVDADIEAPGLTWLIGHNNDGGVFSYLDLLEMIQNAKDDEYEDVVKNASDFILSSTLSVETETQRVEHFFIPAYRYKEQLLDVYATPNSIVRQRNKRYVLATVLSKIADQLECDAVIVDLRAGISEYSSAFLFDPRIQKFFVTSTSSQSVLGTCFVLSQIIKGLSFGVDTKIPKIFLNMIPSNLAEAEKEAIIVKLQEVYPSNSFTDDVVIELPFASELIHETTLEQIIENLSDRKFYMVMKNLIQENYVIKSNEPIFHNESDI